MCPCININIYIGEILLINDQGTHKPFPVTLSPTWILSHPSLVIQLFCSERLCAVRATPSVFEHLQIYSQWCRGKCRVVGRTNSARNVGTSLMQCQEPRDFPPARPLCLWT